MADDLQRLNAMAEEIRAMAAGDDGVVDPDSARYQAVMALSARVFGQRVRSLCIFRTILVFWRMVFYARTFG